MKSCSAQICALPTGPSFISKFALIKVNSSRSILSKSISICLPGVSEIMLETFFPSTESVPYVVAFMPNFIAKPGFENEGISGLRVDLLDGTLSENARDDAATARMSLVRVDTFSHGHPESLDLPQIQF